MSAKARITIHSMYGELPESPVLDCTDDRTEQHHKDECDIHKIVAQFNVTGLLDGKEPRPLTEAEFADVSELPDYIEAQNTIAQVNEIFANLDSKTRLCFDNDPGLFMDYVSSASHEDLVSMGFVQEDTGHSYPLDVTVPTDTNLEKVATPTETPASNTNDKGEK